MNSGDTQKQLEPLYDSGGQATGAVAAMQDLTRCTRAEQVLGESEERFRTVVEASKDAIITIDRDGLITVFNPAAEHMFGHKSQEILGQPVHVLMPEEHRQRHHQAREEYFATGKPRGLIGKTVELSALRANGQVFWIELSLSEGWLDGGPFVVGVIRDIADRKLAEQVVRASEEQYRGLVELSPDAILINRNNRFTFANPAAVRLFGASSSDQLLGKSPFELFHPDYHETIRARIHQLGEGQRAELIEEKVVRLDGTAVDVEVAASPFTDREGQGIQVILRDITDRKRAEQADRRFNEQLLVATDRERAARELARNLEIQKVLGAILRDSQESMPLQQFLERTLDRLLGVSWIALESRAAIFLMEENPGVLIMKAQRGLASSVLNECRQVPVGTCLCGRAAMTCQIVFASRVDERHERSYPDMQPHGHYCIPMVSAGEVIGVITFYLSEGHARSAEEERFLTAVADVLAGAVRHKQGEDSLRESEKKYRGLFESSRDAIVTAEPPSWRFASGNPAAVKMFGAKSEKEFISFNPWELSPKRQPDGRDSVEKAKDMLETAIRAAD